MTDASNKKVLDKDHFNSYLTKDVSLIPFPENEENFKLTDLDTKRLKVCAYCRVSTEEEMQLNSLENQIIHYTNYIRSNPEWHFVGIYSDSGKSGTRIKQRNGFNKMIRHALDGKINLIICKSISRFSRNVVDALNIVRLLRDSEVNVLFQTEGINTGEMQSEFILTMLSATVQEESRVISENLTWAYRRRFKRGDPKYVRILGYTIDKTNQWVVVDNEALIVKEAFTMVLQGNSPREIANEFTKKGYSKVNGDLNWSSSSIRYMLLNDKYTGSVLCQKTYTNDYLSHEVRKNKGEYPQYMINNHHEAIIDKTVFDKAQQILLQRTKLSNRKNYRNHVFSGRIQCGECGRNYSRTNSSKSTFWRCQNHSKGRQFCSMGGVKEERIIKTVSDQFDKRYEINGLGQGKRQIIRLIKDIKNVESTLEADQNWIRLALENALLAENRAMIESDDISTYTNKRQEIEAQLSSKQPFWELIESDSVYRENSLRILEELQSQAWPKKELSKVINDFNFLRAWIIRIIILPGERIRISWLNGEVSDSILLTGDEEIANKSNAKFTKSESKGNTSNSQKRKK